MARFADLSPCTYFGEANAAFLRSVGWLQRGKPFATGAVDSEVLARLIELAKDPLQRLLLAGVPRAVLLCGHVGGATRSWNGRAGRGRMMPVRNPASRPKGP
jgi:hypothetical protein